MKVEPKRIIDERGIVTAWITSDNRVGMAEARLAELAAILPHLTYASQCQPGDVRFCDEPRPPLVWETVMDGLIRSGPYVILRLHPRDCGTNYQVTRNGHMVGDYWCYKNIDDAKAAAQAAAEAGR